jgi:SOS-response transcriptional repressor LexA
MGANARREGASEDGHDDRLLSARQRKIIKVREDSVRTRGYPPSFLEIAKALGLASTSSVPFQISALMKMGCLSLDADSPWTGVPQVPRLSSASGKREGNDRWRQRQWQPRRLKAAASQPS